MSMRTPLCLRRRKKRSVMRSCRTPCCCCRRWARTPTWGWSFANRVQTAGSSRLRSPQHVCGREVWAGVAPLQALLQCLIGLIPLPSIELFFKAEESGLLWGCTLNCGQKWLYHWDQISFPLTDWVCLSLFLPDPGLHQGTSLKHQSSLETALLLT